MGRPRKTEEPVKAEKKPRTKKVENPVINENDDVISEEVDNIKADTEEEAPVEEKKIVAIEYIVNVREDSWLNVRRGPGRKFEAIAKLKNGDSVFVYEKKDGFARIGDDVWVDTKFLISRL